MAGHNQPISSRNLASPSVNLEISNKYKSWTRHGVAVVDSSEESRNYHNCDVHLSQYGHENKTESKKGWGSKIATDILPVLIG